MKSEIQIGAQSEGFESIKHIDENGVEFWIGRELMPLLGYENWRVSEEVFARAMRAALNSDQVTENHFVPLTKMVEIGSGTKRKVKDWKLDRYACYLIAQNGDSSKKPIALAQTYFAVQTRKQEIIDILSDAQKRLFIRGEVSSQNKKLFRTAKQAGVSNFGLFNDAGYKGLYGMSIAGIEVRKGVKKGELLDRAGSAELAANLFRITQTDEKLKNNKVRSDSVARETHFMVGGKVREAIKDIGGEMPENLKPEKHIAQLKKDLKRGPKVGKLASKKLSM